MEERGIKGRKERGKKGNIKEKKKKTAQIVYLQEFLLVTGGSVCGLLRCCSGKESACQCRR